MKAKLPIRLDLGSSAMAVFEARGISPSDLTERVHLLWRHLGQPILNKVIHRPIEDQGAAITISDSSALLAAVDGCQGLSSVAKTIRRNPNGSLNTPVGEWLQLTVGAALRSHKFEISFEQPVGDGGPKDIVMRSRSVQIECKAFLMSPWLKEIWRCQIDTCRRLVPSLPKGRWRIAVDRDWTTNRSLDDVIELVEVAHRAGKDVTTIDTKEVMVTASEHVMEPYGGLTAGGIFGTFPRSGVEVPFSASYESGVSVLFEGPHFDQFLRYSVVLAEKYYQMVEGWCNILALDTDQYTGQRDSLSDRLRAILEAQHDSRISGLLLLSKSRGKDQTEVRFLLVENSAASVPVDSSLASVLSQPFLLV